MVLNAAVQMLREADELKEKILKFKSGTSMLQERSLWVTQQQLQKLYQKVLVLDLDYALDKKVEQDLWNIGFKQQIEALQAISKDKKNPLRSEGQAMLSWVLQAAAGFYLCLLHQICTAFKLDLPFRRRASLLGWVEGWGAGEVAAGARLPPPAAARYICQHCLVHLGDLARYRQQLRVAHTFYRHALVVSAHSGQPYNQLALVAWRRGRRLAALYWHVRSLLVRAPFPPAPNNLARTLAAAAASRDIKELPVLGESPPSTPPPAACPHSRLDAHSYVNELIRVMHIIHTVEQLDTATELVDSLNSSLTALVATDSFDSMTLIKMACVIIWLVHSTTEEFTLDSSALTESEAAAAHLSQSLAAGALLALLLPAYTVSSPLHRALPAVCVWAQWWCAHPQVRRSAAWATRPQLWPALAHTLNTLADMLEGFQGDKYDTVPLPEDEELLGFTPLEAAHKELQFPNHAAWDTYGGRVPTVEGDTQSSIEIFPTCLSSSPELERKVRAHRLMQLGKRLAELNPEHLTYTEEDGKVSFSATSTGGEQLSRALAELRLAASREGDTRDAEGESSGEQPSAPPPPVVISEADFREKVLCAVREKRVGILKPQGSLERAREERAHATTHDAQECATSEEGSIKGDDKKDSRKPRVNIAMAAIMRKQEEINKQVKFVTPPLTPDSTADSTESQSIDKPKIMQPKAIKSLANLPIGRKTGGILSLKDKSAGYPHLVNADSEPAKKPSEETKEAKQQTPPAQYQKRQDGGHQTSPNWGSNYNDGIRANFQKNYGIQNTGISYNPNYPPPGVNNQGIRLPVVNPKEIDVRTAAIQKQNSRQDLFQDGNKIINHNYQISGDKKNFLNDLPPRFANQYRYWQNAQENQFNDNKFRDDNFKANFNQPPPQPPPASWMSPGQSENLTMPWWKPENQPNFSNFTAAPMNVPNFYTPHLNPNMAYPNVQYNQMQNQNLGQQKSELNYLQSPIGQPQLQTLQNLVTSPNFNTSLNSLSSFPPTVTYDSSMYPQFNNKMSYPPPQMKMPEKPQGFEGNKELMNIGGLGFGPNVMDLQQRNLGTNLNFSMNNDSLNNDRGVAKNLDQIRLGETTSAASPLSAGNTYSLFSGTAEAPAWAAHQQNQSLWSGPGPSPLERLLEQQKQKKQPPAPQ